MIIRDFARHRTILEKYDVVKARSELGEQVKFGYQSNQIGFGWTNAAFIVLFDEMSPQSRSHLSKPAGSPR